MAKTNAAPKRKLLSKKAGPKGGRTNNKRKVPARAKAVPKAATASAAKPSARLSAAWPLFQETLASLLKTLKEDQFLILLVKGTNRFVQFSAQGSFGMRAETTSNSFLARPDQLGKQQIDMLTGAGWRVPTGSPEEATPENDPDGSPNFFAEFKVPVAFGAVAALTVRTLAEILRVPHPGSLEYEAFETVGKSAQPLLLPALGLKLVRPPNTEGREEKAQLLLAALRSATQIGDLAFDKSGDVGIQYRTVSAFARLLDDPPRICIYSTIMSNVEASPEVYARLNDINAHQFLLRFILHNGRVIGFTDIPSEPIVAAHVAMTLDHFCHEADRIGVLLRQEFGEQDSLAADKAPSLKN